MIFGIRFLPDSPRWYVASFIIISMSFQQTLYIRLVNQGRYSEALAVISALEDKHHSHKDVQRTFIAIREASLAERTTSANNASERAQLKELTHGGRSQNFRRATLGVVIQAFQQITGINLIT